MSRRGRAPRRTEAVGEDGQPVGSAPDHLLVAGHAPEDRRHAEGGEEAGGDERRRDARRLSLTGEVRAALTGRVPVAAEARDRPVAVVGARRLPVVEVDRRDGAVRRVGRAGRSPRARRLAGVHAPGPRPRRNRDRGAGRARRRASPGGPGRASGEPGRPGEPGPSRRSSLGSSLSCSREPSARRLATRSARRTWGRPGPRGWPGWRPPRGRWPRGRWSLSRTSGGRGR